MESTANNLSFGELYAALKQKHVNVEMYESVNSLLSNTDLSLKPEYCFEIINGSLIVLIDHNKELLLAVDIANNEITNIQADTIDAATTANDAIEAMLK